jgi:hypothetical protein
VARAERIRFGWRRGYGDGNIRFEADQHSTFARPPDCARLRGSFAGSILPRETDFSLPDTDAHKLHPRPVCPCALYCRPSGLILCSSELNERNGNVNDRFKTPG